ncbi:unnamed protein product [Rhodiola kirilowii]
MRGTCCLRVVLVSVASGWFPVVVSFYAVESPVFRLTTFGSERFRKIDSDKWEFANKGFVRGKKHLLKSIQRRKSPQMHQGIGFGGSLEVGRAGFEDELNKLREERKILTHEVAKLQIKQDGTAQHMELVNQRIQVAERKQKQMVTFLFKLVTFHNFHYFRVPASLLLLSDMYFFSQRLFVNIKC